MKSYDLLVLSPIEFEDLSKDLLEKHLNISLESFGAGKDGGIDLRHSRTLNNDLIVQCKRYKDFSSLKAALKSEVPKIKKLKPKRYLVTTTVSLSPSQKTKIAEMLKPFVKKNSDIFGHSEINSLISKYPSVEKKHYKLWLSSSAVLSNLLHAKMMNQSELELKNVKRNLMTYAENPSYSEALKVLQKNHFVIISGLPGIGKTTLARMLVYKLLGDKQFDEFIFVSGSIDEAFEMYESHKKQLFLFDDFLGTNFLEQKIGRNEDSRLLDFMKMVSRSKNTALILTTREYILKQAQSVFRQLDDGAIKNGKYIIDLSEYTKLVKARILYNHLFVSEIPAAYLGEFLKQKVYQSIINHKNYNPRLIEIVLNEKPWEAFSVEEFPDAMTEYFDNPYRIWENIYENEISENARSVLEVLLTATAPIMLDNLVAATRAYLHSKKIDNSRSKIDKALKELEGTFISSEVHKEDGIIVNFQNPSVYDFLRDYYSSTRQQDLCGVIESAEFLNQLTGIFTHVVHGSPLSYGGRITLQEPLKQSIIDKILRDFPTMKWSAYSRPTVYGSHISGFDEPSMAEKIYTILFSLGLSKNREVRALMLEQYKLYLSNYSSNQAFIIDTLELIEHFQKELNQEELDIAVHDAASGIKSLSDFEELDLYESDYPVAFDLLMQSEHFTDYAEDALLTEAQEADDERLDTILNSIAEVASRYGLNAMTVEEIINDRQREATAFAESDFYRENISAYRDTNSMPRPNLSNATHQTYTKPPSESELIDDMFDSLQ